LGSTPKKSSIPKKGDATGKGRGKVSFPTIPIFFNCSGLKQGKRITAKRAGKNSYKLGKEINFNNELRKKKKREVSKISKGRRKILNVPTRQ